MSCRHSLVLWIFMDLIRTPKLTLYNASNKYSSLFVWLDIQAFKLVYKLIEYMNTWTPFPILHFLIELFLKMTKWMSSDNNTSAFISLFLFSVLLFSLSLSPLVWSTWRIAIKLLEKRVLVSIYVLEIFPLIKKSESLWIITY